MKILKITPHPTKTLIWWYNRRSDIDFDPPYQRRGRLWSNDDKAFLVDSIINGFDVPKLYLADFQFGQSTLNFSKLPYAIIDGKQRLEAIFDFFESRLTLRSDFKYRKDASLQLGGLSLKDLRLRYGKVAEDFENASLDIMSVVAEDEADINEIFVRLNKSKPLTGAEIRNAVVGPVSDLVRFLSSHPFFLENIKFSVARAGDLNLAAKLLSFEFYGRLVGTKKADLDSFASTKDEPEKLELASRRVLDNLNAMCEVFIPNDPLLSSAGMVPVYYWFLRDVEPVERSGVREFLLHFEEMRKRNRDLQRVEDGDVLQRSLARFDTLNRSTNDLQSHIGRVAILKEHYGSWPFA
jgi:Protein of unknown function DUF262